MFDAHGRPSTTICHPPRPNCFAQSSVEYGRGTLDYNSSAAAGTKARRGRKPWGSVSYADLITQAITTSPERRLTLQQIYGWIVCNVPYFKDKAQNGSNAQWKNSIRHNLSLNERFVRMDNGWRSAWMINPVPIARSAVRPGTSRDRFELKRGRKTADSKFTLADRLFSEILPDNPDFECVYSRKLPSPNTDVELIQLLQQRLVHPTSLYTKPPSYSAGKCERAQKAGTAAGAGKRKVKAGPSSTLTSSNVSAAEQAQASQASSSRDHDNQELPKFKHEEFIMEDYGEEESTSGTLNEGEVIFGDAGESYTEEESIQKDHEVVCTPEFIKEEPQEESPFETVFCDAPNIKQEVEDNFSEDAEPSASDWDDPLEPTAVPTSQDKTAAPTHNFGSLKRVHTAHAANAKKARLAPKTFSGTVSIGPQPPPGPFDPYDASLQNAVIGFFVSLKRIPVEKRDPTKQKILELIDAIADHDLDPDWIKIMVVKPTAKKRPTIKKKTTMPVKIAPVQPNVNLPTMVPLQQTNAPPKLPTQVPPTGPRLLLPKPHAALSDGPQTHTSIGAGLVTQPQTSMSFSLPIQPQTTNTSMGLVPQTLTSMAIDLPTRVQTINTSMGLAAQQLTSVPINLPAHPQQTSTSMGLVTQQLTCLPMNLPAHPQQTNTPMGLVAQQLPMNLPAHPQQTNTPMGLVAQQLPINLPTQLHATNTPMGLVTQQLPLPINLPQQPQINPSMSLVPQPMQSMPINTLPTHMQTSTITAIARPQITSSTEMGVYKQLQTSAQTQTTNALIYLPTRPPGAVTSDKEMEMPREVRNEGPS